MAASAHGPDFGANSREEAIARHQLTPASDASLRDRRGRRARRCPPCSPPAAAAQTERPAVHRPAPPPPPPRGADRPRLRGGSSAAAGTSAAGSSAAGSSAASSAAAGHRQAGRHDQPGPRAGLHRLRQDDGLLQRLDLGLRQLLGDADGRQRRRHQGRALARRVLGAVRRQADLDVPPQGGREVLRRHPDDLGRREVLPRRGEHAPRAAGSSSTRPSRPSPHRTPTPWSSRPSTRGRRCWPTSPARATGSCPNKYQGKAKETFYTAPVGTGPFMWDTWSKGKASR